MDVITIAAVTQFRLELDMAGSIRWYVWDMWDIDVENCWRMWHQKAEWGIYNESVWMRKQKLVRVVGWYISVDMEWRDVAMVEQRSGHGGREGGKIGYLGVSLDHHASPLFTTLLRFLVGFPRRRRARERRRGFAVRGASQAAALRKSRAHLCEATLHHRYSSSPDNARCAIAARTSHLGSAKHCVPLQACREQIARENHDEESFIPSVSLVQGKCLDSAPWHLRSFRTRTIKHHWFCGIQTIGVGHCCSPPGASWRAPLAIFLRAKPWPTIWCAIMNHSNQT